VRGECPPPYANSWIRPWLATKCNWRFRLRINKLLREGKAFSISWNVLHFALFTEMIVWCLIVCKAELLRINTEPTDTVIPITDVGISKYCAVSSGFLGIPTHH